MWYKKCFYPPKTDKDRFWHMNFSRKVSWNNGGFYWGVIIYIKLFLHDMIKWVEKSHGQKVIMNKETAVRRKVGEAEKFEIGRKNVWSIQTEHDFLDLMVLLLAVFVLLCSIVLLFAESKQAAKTATWKSDEWVSSLDSSAVGIGRKMSRPFLNFRFLPSKYIQGCYKA